MTRFILAAAASLFFAAPALAEIRPVTVNVPANVSDPAVAAEYVQDLRRASERVCRAHTGDIMGHGLHVFKECMESTLTGVAALDPTGLLDAALKSEESFDRR